MMLSVLAERQRCVKSNVSYITRVMQGAGLVELNASQKDQRSRVISATKLGVELFAAQPGHVNTVHELN